LNFYLKQKRIFISENPFLVSLRTTNFGDKSTIQHLKPTTKRLTLQ